MSLQVLYSLIFGILVGILIGLFLTTEKLNSAQKKASHYKRQCMLARAENIQSGIEHFRDLKEKDEVIAYWRDKRNSERTRKELMNG